MIDRLSNEQRRRPATVSLNIQWVPVPQRSGIYQLSGNGVSRKSKTVTFFGTGEMRGQQTNATTPPSSDYTDAYLSVFAPKPTPSNNYVKESKASFFTSVTPVPLKPLSVPLSRPSRSSTIETRLTTNFTNKDVPKYSDIGDASLSTKSTSNISTDFDSRKSINYSSVSTTPYSLSSTSTFTSNYSTSLVSPSSSSSARSISPTVTSKPSTSVHSRPTETISTVNREDKAYGNIYRPLPAYSVEAYPPTSTITTTSLSSLSSTLSHTKYVPNVSFQAAPFASINLNNVNNQTTLSTSKVEKIFERPESLIVQQSTSENIRSNDDIAKSSKSIETLESTIKKYDTLISEISEVLASVSPLSSTVSSLSPSKSLLDYSISSENSPTRQKITGDDDSIGDLPSAVINLGSKRGSGDHLIREDSYEKIVTVLSDLEQESVPSTGTSSTIQVEHENILSSVVEQSELESEKYDETQNTQCNLEEEPLLQSNNIEATFIASIPSPIEYSEEQHETKSEISIVPDSTEQITLEDNLTVLQTLETSAERAIETVNETEENKKNDKRVRWSDSVVDNEDKDDEQEEQIDADNFEQTETIDEHLNFEPVLSDVSAEATIILRSPGLQSSTSSCEFEEQSNLIEELSILTPLAHESTVVQETVSPVEVTSVQQENELEASSTTQNDEAPLETAATIDENLITQDIVIESPIEVLPESVTTRFISRDVYHGYLGDHPSCVKEITENDDDDECKMSLIASLRDTISKPVISLIEDIQYLVSNTQVTCVQNQADNNGSELNESTDMKENPSENQTQIEIEPSDTISSPQYEYESNEIQMNKNEISTSVTITEIDENVETQVIKKNDVTSRGNEEITQQMDAMIEESSKSIESFQTEALVDLKSLEVESVKGSSTEFTPSIIVDPTQSSSVISENDQETGTVQASVTEASEKTEQNDETVLQVEISLTNDETDQSEQPMVKEDLVQTNQPVVSESEKLNEFQSIIETDDVEFKEIRVPENTPEINGRPDEGIHSFSEIISERRETDAQDVSKFSSINDTTNEEESNLKSCSSNDFNISSQENANIEFAEQHQSSAHETFGETSITSLTDISDVMKNQPESSVQQLNVTIDSATDPTTSTKFESEDQFHQNSSANEQNSEILNENRSFQTNEIQMEEPVGSSVETKGRIILMEEDSYVSSAADQSFVVSDGDVQEFLECERRLRIGERNWSIESVLSDDFDNRLDDDDLSAEEYEIINDTVQSLIQNALEMIKTESHPPSKLNESISFEENSLASGVDSVDTTIRRDEKSQSHESTTECETSAIDQSYESWTGLSAEKAMAADRTVTLDEEKSASTETSPDNHILAEQTDVTDINDSLSLQVTNEIQQTTDETTSNTKSIAVDNHQELEQLREPSPSITEDDSLDLIHALQHHSMIKPQLTASGELKSSAEMDANLNIHSTEKSSSSTSSPVTSSDCYVSYAIHEMGDSSQDRLPALPLAADLPIYQVVLATTEPSVGEKKQDLAVPEQKPDDHQISTLLQTKDDDLTELDATENLTSYSDDILIHRLKMSVPDYDGNLDSASSTDEDVDNDNLNDLEEVDITNLHRIIEQMNNRENSSGTMNTQGYQRYDLVTTSSNSNESGSKAQAEDFYVIPGLPGLWRPSVDDQAVEITFDRTADADESQERSEQRTKLTHVQTHKIAETNVNEDNEPISKSSDVFSRAANEFGFDMSEAESFRTCASTINSSSATKSSKQNEHEQNVPEENVYLIRERERERERGVSLPLTMKIDCDDIDLRLSSSTPIERQDFSRSQNEIPSPSTFAEPIPRTESSSRASTPSLSSVDGELKAFPSNPSSWLNSVSTTTSIIDGPDGPLEAKTTIHKSAKGPISVAECDNNGKYISVENTSRSKSVSLSGWKLCQEIENGETFTFKFPENCVLKSNQTIKIWTRGNESDRRHGDLAASSVSSWHTSSNVTTTLFNADGKDRAALTKKTVFS